MAANSSGCVPMALTFSPPWGRTRYSILSSFRGIQPRRYSLRALYHIARPEQARPGIGRPDNGLCPHIYMLYITVLRHAGVAKSARPWYHRLTRTCLSLSIDGTVKKQVLWRDTLENGSSGFAAQRRAAVHPAADQPDAAAQLAGHHGTAGHYYHAIYRRGHGGPPGRVPVGGSRAGGFHHLAVRRAVLRGSYGLQRADGAAGGRRPSGRGAQHPQAGAGAVPGLQRSHGGTGGLRRCPGCCGRSRRSGGMPLPISWCTVCSCPPSSWTTWRRDSCRPPAICARPVSAWCSCVRWMWCSTPCLFSPPVPSGWAHYPCPARDWERRAPP